MHMKHDGMNRFTPTKYIPQINIFLIYFYGVFGIFHTLTGLTGSCRCELVHAVKRIDFILLIFQQFRFLVDYHTRPR